MEHTNEYIPIDRFYSLALGEPLPERTHGAALFADISGFTPLTEALARALGPRRGAEEVNRCLNQVYDALITEVHRQGGSVVGFAGDAITCWFDQDDGLRASSSGLAMQAALRQFAATPIPGGGTVALSAKVAIAVGPVRRFVVGDPEIQRFDVLAGETLERMAAAEHLAAKGEVVVDAALDAAVLDAVRVTERRVDPDTGRNYIVVQSVTRDVPDVTRPSLPLHTLPDGQLEAWVPPPVRERGRHGRDVFLAELRPAIPLFLRFDGIEYDADEGAASRLDGYICWVQQVLARYGGYLLQIVIGDKGSYLYATFGAMVAHDDDAARAVAASLDLRTPPLEYIRVTGIGIAAGRAYCGPCGAAACHTYAVMGDPVNLAARLMQAAAGPSILVSNEIHQAATSFAWESLPPLRLKGKSEPAAVFMPVAATARHIAQPHEARYTLPIVGRETELAEIERTIQRVTSGQGQIITLVGDAGMGKSRLVAEVLKRAAVGFDSYLGECQSYGTHNSYHAWHSIWRTFFAIDDVETTEDTIRILETELAAVDPTLVPRLPLLGVVLNLSIPDNDLTRSLDAKLRKASLEALLVDCLRARACGRPLLLVIEDCHWLDALSRDLLVSIARAVADVPVLVVAAHRPPEPGQPQVLPENQLSCLTRIELTSFTAPEAERLITLKLEQLTGANGRASETLMTRVVSRAEGNPFYIEELLNYLHDCGIDSSDLQALEGLDLPPSLHSLILSRIDQLTGRQKIAVKVASVIGRQFRMAWLWGAHPEIGSTSQVQDDLDGLSRLDLTPLDQLEPERVYLFKHIVTREVAYESLPFATRAVLHGRLGGFIEGHYAETLDQYVDLLAYHYDLSNEEAKKREYLQKAGEAAQAAYANEAAIDYYRRLLMLLPETERTTTLLKLGQVLELVGEWGEASDLYRQALARAEQVDDLFGQASARRAMGWLLRKQGAYHEAATWLMEARGIFEPLGNFAALSQILADIGEVHRQVGACAEARQCYDDSLRTAALAPGREGLAAKAQALKGAGTLANQQGKHADARTLYEESLAIQRELGDRPGIAVLLNNLGVVARHLGEHAAARALNEESLAVFREIGDRWSAGQLLNNLGCVIADLGEHATARQLLGESLTIRRQLGDQGGLALSLNSLGDVLLDVGDYRGARPVLVESLTINRELGDRFSLAYLLEDFAALAAAEGEPDRAIRLAAAATAAQAEVGAQLAEAERARFDRLQEPARRSLPADLVQMLWDEGQAMGLEQAVDYALHTQNVAIAVA